MLGNSGIEVEDIGETVASAFVEGQPDIAEWLDNNAHVLAWKRYHQRPTIRSAKTRAIYAEKASRWPLKPGYAQMRRISLEVQEKTADEFSEYLRTLSLNEQEARAIDLFKRELPAEPVQPFNQRNRPRKCIAPKAADRLCSNVNSTWQSRHMRKGATEGTPIVTSLLPGEVDIDPPTERTAFLIRYNPNRRRQ